MLGVGLLLDLFLLIVVLFVLVFIDRLQSRLKLITQLILIPDLLKESLLPLPMTRFTRLIYL